LLIRHCCGFSQDEAKSAFDEWLKLKREQRKIEAKKEQEQIQKEPPPDNKKRSKREAERAFKKYAYLASNQCYFISVYSP